MGEAAVQTLPRVGERAAPKTTLTAPAAPRKFLSEVQGLRALAVLMVVSYHVWFGRISGGVDVFLLISAFFLTRQFIRKLETGEPFGLIKYWIKLSQRLMPMLILTLLATLVATFLLLPQTRWSNILDQTWASLFYYQNWFLAAQAVDYYTPDHGTASPLQHFWSLAIQGQFFLLWPIIFTVVAFLVRMFRWRARLLLLWSFSGIFVVSLVFSIMTTYSNQAFAYFDTRTRLWEFALGSILALTLPYLRLARGARLFLGWFGVAAMLSCGFILHVGQQFPGYMALWPTLAASCVIAAGSTGSRFGVDRLLSMKPLVKLGNNSYALYLFHWPVLVIYLSVSGRDQAGLAAGLAIIASSIFAAWFMTKLIDMPLRKNKWFEQKSRHSLVLSVICIASVALPLTGWQQHLEKNRPLLSTASTTHPGAAALWPGYRGDAVGNAPLLPTFAAVDGDWPKFPSECEIEAAELINRCENLLDTPSKKIVVLGSSHAHVLNTALLDMAADNNWSLISITRGNCPVSTDTAEGLSDSCVAFNQRTLKEVLDTKPDVVVTTSTRTNVDPGIPERLDPSWVEEVGALNEAGIPVVAVRDTPRFIQSVPVCLEDNPENYAACNAPRADLFSPSAPTDTAAAGLTKTSFIDLTNSFCDDAVCPSVIGNVIVYKDDNHVTSTYMKTLRPIFEREFLAATGWKVS